MASLLYDYWAKLTNKIMIKQIAPNNFDSWDRLTNIYIYIYIYLFLFASRGSGYLNNVFDYVEHQKPIYHQFDLNSPNLL